MLGSFLCLVGRFVLMSRWGSNLLLRYCVEVIRLSGFCFSAWGCFVFPLSLVATLTFASNMGWVIILMREFGFQ